jgi:hypothetical protein
MNVNLYGVAHVFWFKQFEKLNGVSALEADSSTVRFHTKHSSVDLGFLTTKDTRGVPSLVFLDCGAEASLPVSDETLLHYAEKAGRLCYFLM